MRIFFASLVLTSLAFANLAGAAIQFQSGEKRVSLVELYTSEGCSSCPPAEAWLAWLKDSPELWKDFAPVAFHVEYWDSPGWKDQWASPEFSERQRAYAGIWKSDNIYTPCFVVNGKEWRGWFLSRNVPTASEAAGILTISSADTNRWNATFIPVGKPAGAYDIHAALLGGGLSSEVTGGENRGGHLPHEFAVLNAVQIGMVTTDGVAKAKFISDTARFRAHGNLAIVAWVSSAGQIAPIQATGGWLTLSKPRSK